MSILIMGMGMPKKYPVTVTIFPDGISVVKTISVRRFTTTAIIPADRPNVETGIQQEYLQNWHEEGET